MTISAARIGKRVDRYQASPLRPLHLDPTI